MEVDPPESPCGGRLQTAMSCYGRTAAVVNVMVNGVAYRSRHVGMRETSASEPLITHRNFSGEGSPTVIFEGAGHTAGYAWAGVAVDGLPPVTMAGVRDTAEGATMALW